jgi:hypothetical protein
MSSRSITAENCRRYLCHNPDAMAGFLHNFSRPLTIVSPGMPLFRPISVGIYLYFFKKNALTCRLNQKKRIVSYHGYAIKCLKGN